jgi:membrane-associated phospholipid phosphatase
MQGGHPDGLRFRFGRVGSVEESSGNESEVSVDDVITLGTRLDKIVHIARESFGLVLALPVAWIQLHPTIESLKAHKQRRVHEGIDSILWIQTFRNKTLDGVMQLFSFCAEEEFYLLILPLLFWNGWYELARRLTFVVVTGLFVGNIIKDVFELPRPSSPPVWRPSNQEHLDSTALQDFGFPSTHAMNSVSNALLVAWYFWSNEESGNNALLLIASLTWITCLSFSRLYLGAHTPTDVRGGLGLGTIVIATYVFCYRTIDASVNACTPYQLIVFTFALSTVALLLCPQPRPPTPTFHQNAFIAGLLSGLIVGSRSADDYGLSSPNFGSGTSSYMLSPWVNLAIPIMRNVLGFAMTILLRIVVKKVVTLIVEKVFKISTKPQIEVVKRRSKAKKGKKIVVKLFTRDIDIIAVAAVKMLTYFFTATCITFFFPITWRAFIEAVLQ